MRLPASIPVQLSITLDRTSRYCAAMAFVEYFATASRRAASPSRRRSSGSSSKRISASSHSLFGPYQQPVLAVADDQRRRADVGCDAGQAHHHILNRLEPALSADPLVGGQADRGRCRSPANPRSRARPSSGQPRDRRREAGNRNCRSPAGGSAAARESFCSTPRSRSRYWRELNVPVQPIVTGPSLL